MQRRTWKRSGQHELNLCCLVHFSVRVCISFMTSVRVSVTPLWPFTNYDVTTVLSICRQMQQSRYRRQKMFLQTLHARAKVANRGRLTCNAVVATFWDIKTKSLLANLQADITEDHKFCGYTCNKRLVSSF